jgi:transcriptional regulator
LSQKDIAVLIGLSERAVRNIEKRALAKLRRHPALRELWREFETEFLESCGGLTGAEIAALFDLAQTDEERAALRHVLKAISGSASG